MKIPWQSRSVRNSPPLFPHSQLLNPPLITPGAHTRFSWLLLYIHAPFPVTCAPYEATVSRQQVELIFLFVTQTWDSEEKTSACWLLPINYSGWRPCCQTARLQEREGLSTFCCPLSWCHLSNATSFTQVVETHSRSSSWLGFLTLAQPAFFPLRGTNISSAAFPSQRPGVDSMEPSSKCSNESHLCAHESHSLHEAVFFLSLFSGSQSPIKHCYHYVPLSQLWLLMSKVHSVLSSVALLGSRRLRPHSFF